MYHKSSNCFIVLSEIVLINQMDQVFFPNEIIFTICSFLDAPDLLSVGYSCSRFSEISGRSDFWHLDIEEKFMRDPYLDYRVNRIDSRVVSFNSREEFMNYKKKKYDMKEKLKKKMNKIITTKPNKYPILYVIVPIIFLVFFTLSLFLSAIGIVAKHNIVLYILSTTCCVIALFGVLFFLFFYFCHFARITKMANSIDRFKKRNTFIKENVYLILKKEDRDLYDRILRKGAIDLEIRKGGSTVIVILGLIPLGLICFCFSLRFVFLSFSSVMTWYFMIPLYIYVFFLFLLFVVFFSAVACGKKILTHEYFKVNYFRRNWEMIRDFLVTYSIPLLIVFVPFNVLVCLEVLLLSLILDNIIPRNLWFIPFILFCIIVVFLVLWVTHFFEFIIFHFIYEKATDGEIVVEKIINFTTRYFHFTEKNNEDFIRCSFASHFSGIMLCVISCPLSCFFLILFLLFFLIPNTILYVIAFIIPILYSFTCIFCFPFVTWYYFKKEMDEY